MKSLLAKEMTALWIGMISGFLGLGYLSSRKMLTGYYMEKGEILFLAD
jgi:hypothetical protein